jgi:hypothetical protein
LVENPLREMDESVAISVSGDVGELSESFGEGFERECGVVGLSTWWFVVEVPEYYDFVLFLYVGSLFGFDHVYVDDVVVVVVGALDCFWFEGDEGKGGFGGDEGVEVERCICVVEE